MWLWPGISKVHPNLFSGIEKSSHLLKGPKELSETGRNKSSQGSLCMRWPREESRAQGQALLPEPASADSPWPWASHFGSLLICRFPTSYTSLIFPGLKLQLGQDLVLQGDRNLWNFPMKCSPTSPGAEWQHWVLGGLMISQGQLAQQVKEGVLRHQAQNFNPITPGLENFLANWFSSSSFYIFSPRKLSAQRLRTNEWRVAKFTNLAILPQQHKDKLCPNRSPWFNNTPERCSDTKPEFKLHLTKGEMINHLINQFFL